MFAHVFRRLIRSLSGRALARSITRNDRAVDQLDEAVREVLDR